MGVRQGEEALKEQLNEIILRKHAEIETILDRHGVPLLEAPAVRP
jgi:hypothetical protein